MFYEKIVSCGSIDCRLEAELFNVEAVSDTPVYLSRRSALCYGFLVVMFSTIFDEVTVAATACLRSEKSLVSNEVGIVYRASEERDTAGDVEI